MVYFELLKESEVSNIAPYWKRILSGIFDISIIYGFYFIISFLTRNEFPHVRFMTLVFSQIYFFIFYLQLNQTIGNMIMKTKVVFIEVNKKNKNKCYLLRSVYKSLLFVPLFNLFYLITFYGITLISTLKLLKNPTVKKNKIMLWDILSKMIVVEKSK